MTQTVNEWHKWPDEKPQVGQVCACLWKDSGAIMTYAKYDDVDECYWELESAEGVEPEYWCALPALPPEIKL